MSVNISHILSLKHDMDTFRQNPENTTLFLKSYTLFRSFFILFYSTISNNSSSFMLSFREGIIISGQEEKFLLSLGLNINII
jgi:hypothetical protein